MTINLFFLGSTIVTATTSKTSKTSINYVAFPQPSPVLFISWLQEKKKKKKKQIKQLTWR